MGWCVRAPVFGQNEFPVSKCSCHLGVSTNDRFLRLKNGYSTQA